MKTLFLIAALAGAVYLIIQTPAGKAWLGEAEPKFEIQAAQHLDQKQKAQIKQLESRIAELETQLVSAPANLEVALDSSEISKKPETTAQIAPVALVSISDTKLLRKRQARLQDIAQKMEMSSLEALVD